MKKSFKIMNTKNERKQMNKIKKVSTIGKSKSGNRMDFILRNKTMRKSWTNKERLKLCLVTTRTEYFGNNLYDSNNICEMFYQFL